MTIVRRLPDVATFPALDFTDLDLSNLSRLDVPGSERVVKLARDATYVGVGLAVLGFQRIQVQRRQVERALRSVRSKVTD